MSDSTSQLQQLLPFLRDPNQTVRLAALQALVPHSPHGAAGRHVFFQSSSGGLKPKDAGVIGDLKVLCRDSSDIAHEAFKTLVNLSDSALLTSSLSDHAFLAFIVSYIANPSAVMADLACMLLANLTGYPTASSALCKLSIPLLSVPAAATPYYAPLSRSGSVLPQNSYPEGNPVLLSALAVLVDAFVRSAETPPTSSTTPQAVVAGGDGTVLSRKADPSRKAELHFLASVFTNISATPTGREFFYAASSNLLLTPTGAIFEYPINKLKSFTEYSNNVRRKGVASTIRNCAFHTPGHKILLTPDTIGVKLDVNGALAPGVNVLENILLPLAGPEEYDLDEMDLLPPALQFLPDTKMRELDPSVRLTHVETLLLLSTTRKGRNYLREHGVYPIIKALHLAETDEQVAEHVVRLVNLLQREEGPETETDGDEHWILNKMAVDSDDDEDQIVEIL